MFEGIKNQMAARLQRSLIEVAIKTLYSEKFDFDAILVRLSRKRDGIHLLRACIAIETSARLSEPLTGTDVENTQKLVSSIESIDDRALFEEVVDVRKELAELYWCKATMRILRRKLAHKNNEESFEGTIYSLEREREGPVAKKDLASLEKVCLQLEAARKDVEIAELADLKDQDPDEYYRYKEELESYQMENEILELEAEDTDIEILEDIEVLEVRLSKLMEDRPITKKD